MMNKMKLLAIIFAIMMAFSKCVPIAFNQIIENEQDDTTTKTFDLEAIVDDNKLPIVVYAWSTTSFISFDTESSDLMVISKSITDKNVNKVEIYITPNSNPKVKFNILVLEKDAEIELLEGKIFIFPFKKDTAPKFKAVTDPALFQAAAHETDIEKIKFIITKNTADGVKTDDSFKLNKMSFTNEDKFLSFTISTQIETTRSPLIYVLYRKINDYTSQAFEVKNLDSILFLNVESYTTVYFKNQKDNYYEFNFKNQNLKSTFKYKLQSELNESIDNGQDVNNQFTKLANKEYSVFGIKADNEDKENFYGLVDFKSELINVEPIVLTNNQNVEKTTTTTNQKFLIQIDSQNTLSYLNIYDKENKAEFYLDSDFEKNDGPKLVKLNRLFSEKFAKDTLNGKFLRVEGVASFSIFSSNNKNVILNSDNTDDVALKLSLVGESARIIYKFKDNDKPFALYESLSSASKKTFSYFEYDQQSIYELFTKDDLEFKEITDSSKSLEKNTLIKVDNNLGLNFYLQSDFSFKPERQVNILSVRSDSVEYTFSDNTLIMPLNSEEVIIYTEGQNDPKECTFKAPCFIPKEIKASLKSKTDQEIIVKVQTIADSTNLTNLVVGKDENEYKNIIFIPITKVEALQEITANISGLKYSFGLSNSITIENIKYIQLPDRLNLNSRFEEDNKVFNFESSLLDDNNDLNLIVYVNSDSSIKASAIITFKLTSEIKSFNFNYSAKFAVESVEGKSSSYVFISSKDKQINLDQVVSVNGVIQKVFTSSAPPKLLTIKSDSTDIKIFASSSSFTLNQEAEPFVLDSTPKYEVKKIENETKYVFTWDKTSNNSGVEYLLFYDEFTDVFSYLQNNQKPQGKVDDVDTVSVDSPADDKKEFVVLAHEKSSGRYALSKVGSKVFSKLTIVDTGKYIQAQAKNYFAITGKNIHIGFVKKLFDSNNSTGLTDTDKVKYAIINTDKDLKVQDIIDHNYSIVKSQTDAQLVVTFDINEEFARSLYYYVITSDQITLNLNDLAESSFYLGNDYTNAQLKINTEAKTLKIDIYTGVEISEIKLDDKSILPTGKSITAKKSFIYSFDVDSSLEKNIVKITANPETNINLSLVKIYLRRAIYSYSSDSTSLDINQYPDRIEGVTDKLYIDISADLFLPANSYLSTNSVLPSPKSFKYDGQEEPKLSDFNKEEDNSLNFDASYITSNSQNSRVLVQSTLTETIKSLKFTKFLVEVPQLNTNIKVDSNGLKIFSLSDNQNQITFVSEGKIKRIGVSYDSSYLFNEKKILESEQFIKNNDADVYTLNLALLSKFDPKINTISVLADPDSSFYISTSKISQSTAFYGNYYFGDQSTQYFVIKKGAANDLYLRVLDQENKVDAKIQFTSSIQFDPKSEFTKIDLNNVVTKQFPENQSYAVVQISSNSSKLIDLNFNTSINQANLTETSYYTLSKETVSVKVTFKGQLTFKLNSGAASYIVDSDQEKKSIDLTDNLTISSDSDLAITITKKDGDDAATFLLNVAQKTDFSLATVTNNAATIKKGYNILNLETTDKLLKKVIVKSEQPAEKLNFSVLDKVYQEGDSLYIQKENIAESQQKGLYSNNFIIGKKSSLLIYSNNSNEITVNTYEINNTASKELADFTIYSDLSLELTTPLEDTNKNLILSVVDADNSCRFNQEQIKKGYNKLSLNKSSKILVECTKETTIKVAALNTDVAYTNADLNPASTFTEKVDFKKTSANLLLTLNTAYLSKLSTKVTYTLIFQDNKASDKTQKRTFSINDFNNSKEKRVSVVINEKNEIIHQVDLLDYERDYDYALFAHDEITGTIMVYDSNRTTLKIKDNSTDDPAKGLAWYFILIIVLGSLILVGLIFFIVKKYVCKPKEETTDTDQNLI